MENSLFSLIDIKDYVIAINRYRETFYLTFNCSLILDYLLFFLRSLNIVPSVFSGFLEA